MKPEQIEILNKCKTHLNTVRNNDPVLQEFGQWNEVKLKAVEKEGAEDGTADRPDPAQTRPGAVEQGIRSAYQNQLTAMCHDEVQLIEQLKGSVIDQLAHIEADRDAEKRRRLQTYKGKSDTGAQLARDTYGKDVEDLENDIDEMRQKISSIESEFNLQCRRHGRSYTNGQQIFQKHHWLLYLILFAVGVLELMLVYSLFQKFKLDKLETYLAAMLPLVAMLLVTHQGGKSMKRWNDEDKANKNWTIGMLVITLLVVFGFAMFRYIAFHKGATFVSALGAFESWAYVLLNLIAYAVGFILSYSAHDSRHSFESAFIEAKLKTKPALEKEVERMEHNINELKDAMRGEVAQHQTDLHTIEADIDEELDNEIKQLKEAKSLYNGIVEHIIQIQQQVNHSYHEALGRYRTYNERTRKTPAPAYWSDEKDNLETRFTEASKIK